MERCLGWLLVETANSQLLGQYFVTVSFIPLTLTDAPGTTLLSNWRSFMATIRWQQIGQVSSMLHLYHHICYKSIGFAGRFLTLLKTCWLYIFVHLQAVYWFTSSPWEASVPHQWLQSVSRRSDLYCFGNVNVGEQNSQRSIRCQ